MVQPTNSVSQVSLREERSAYHTCSPFAYPTASCRSSPVEQRQPLSTTASDTSIKGKRDSLGISYAVMPGGKQIALLKTLLTSACERNCYYCPFRSGRDFRRATFQPNEMASSFMELYRSHAAEGFFLSSGIAGGGVKTQDRLIDTAEILRRKMGYTGYLHLKIMPGAERAQVERSMQLANRVSVNLEAPNSARLAQLAPHKVFIDELLKPLQWVNDIRRTLPDQYGWHGRWPSSVTQFVIGGTDESDLEIMSISAELLKKLRLSRVYYSAFHPVMDTPFENHPPENPMREFRLYQSSFLLRDYGFDLEDLPFSTGGNLPLSVDPKIAWAQINLAENPIEVNTADRQTLLRVPGIGPQSVEDVLLARRHRTLHDLRDLQRTGVIASRAAPFILLDGHRPPRQLTLW